MRFSEARWEPTSDSDDSFSDNLYSFNARLGAIWKINKIFALQASGGYNVTSDVELIGLEADDFDGFMAEVLIKIFLGR